MPSSPWQKRAWGVCALFLVTLCPACSSSGLSEVQGVVKYQGAPIKGAIVIFRPKVADAKSQIPSGITKEDGTFTLAAGNKDGVAPGDYVVTITWPEEAGPPKFKKGSTDVEDVTLPDRLKGRYADAKTSTLTATIKAGKNTLEPFELK